MPGFMIVGFLAHLAMSPASRACRRVLVQNSEDLEPQDHHDFPNPGDPPRLTRLYGRARTSTGC